MKNKIIIKTKQKRNLIKCQLGGMAIVVGGILYTKEQRRVEETHSRPKKKLWTGKSLEKSVERGSIAETKYSICVY